MQYLYGEKLNNPAVLSDFEASTGHVVPTEYKEIVAQHDGALLEPSGIDVWNANECRHEFIECNSLLPFEDRDIGQLTIQQANVGDVDRPDWLVYFGLEAGGYLFGFDYRQGPDPRIVLLHTGNVIGNSSQMIPVAESFSAFIGSLRGYEESARP